MTKHSIKLLSGLGLALAFSLAQAGAAITSIDVAKSDGDEQLLQVVFDGPAIKPNSFSIANPPRIAFDFANTTVKLSKPAVNFSNPVVKSAIAVAANGRARLVLNLAKNAAYSTTVNGNKLTVKLNGDLNKVTHNSAPQEDTTSSYMPDDTPQSYGNPPLGLDFRRGSNGEGRVEIALPAEGTPTDVRREGKNIVIDVMGANLLRSQQRRLDVTDFATPITRVEASNKGRNSRIVIQPHGDWDFSSYQSERKLVIEVRKMAAENTANQDFNLKPRYKGNKLSLNFQNVEVRTVLQVIAEFTGLNIVTSDSVSGNITLRLKDVPWDQALDLILQAKGLDQRRNGNVIHIAPSSEMMAQDKQRLEARQQLTTLEPTRSETFVLRYRSAEDFKKILDGENTTGPKKEGILSSRGSALIDPKTNTLIINDVSSVIDKIRDLVSKTDVAVKQVLIEARIVEATDNWSRDLGVRLSYDRATSNGIISGNPLATTINNRTALNNGTTYTVGNGVNLPINSTTGGTISALYSAGKSALIGLELNALQTEEKGKVISSPRVMTADRMEANIEQGTEIPYQEASSSGATSTSFKKAVMSLKVKPQITPDNHVLLDIQINKDTPSTTYVGTEPAIDTKKVQTQVLVENGGTVVIGGIYQQQVDKTVNKVPFFGDIPFLGALFRNKSEYDKRTELLVFITPKVVDDINSYNR